MVDIGIGALIFANIIGAAFNENIAAGLGWTFALLVWARRLS